MDTLLQPASDLTGQIIGSYRINRRLGRGGMADVYHAVHTELQVERAIKVIRPEFAGAEDFRARFLQEAKAVAKLEHQNIVRIHDFGHANGSYFMVMQFIDGQDLKAILKAQGAMPVTDAVNLCCSIASALSYAHRFDLVHRDIKPENIMVAKDGTPVLMDFGIAKLLTDQGGLTQTGVGIGTPAYMAPEQSQGDPVTPATDIYALAIVLFEALTGQQPYSADTPIAVIVKAVNDPLPRPRSLNAEIPEDIERVILQAADKDPAFRHASAMELLRDLRQASPSRRRSSDVAGAQPAKPPDNRRKILTIVAAVVLLAAVGWLFGPSFEVATQNPGEMEASSGSSSPPQTSAVDRNRVNEPAPPAIEAPPAGQVRPRVDSSYNPLDDPGMNSPRFDQLDAATRLGDRQAERFERAEPVPSLELPLFDYGRSAAEEARDDR